MDNTANKHSQEPSADRDLRDFVPALRFDRLTPLFDYVVRLTMRESRFKRELVDQAAIEPHHRVLDLGCGTGTLAIMAKEAAPGAQLVGLDGDPGILGQATSKAERADVSVQFDHGYSTELPYPDDSFDRVLSTLFFHHLSTEDKRKTARQIARVLSPGGQLHIVDFTRPRDPLMAVAFQIVRTVDGRERTRVNARGELGALLTEEGFESVLGRGEMRTALGTLGLLRAVSPQARS